MACLHDFALFWDGEKFRWRCYYCGKFLDEIPNDELDDSQVWLKNFFRGDEK